MVRIYHSTFSHRVLTETLESLSNCSKQLLPKYAKDKTILEHPSPLRTGMGLSLYVITSAWLWYFVRTQIALTWSFYWPKEVGTIISTLKRRKIRSKKVTVFLRTRTRKWTQICPTPKSKVFPSQHSSKGCFVLLCPPLKGFCEVLQGKSST